MNTEVDLPEGWKVEKLGDVCETTSGGTPSRKQPEYYGGNIPWVKSGELDKGVIFDSEEKITNEAIKNSSAKVFPKGTLLIALYGATIGKLAFLGIDAATNQAICGIFKSDKIDQRYLYNFLFFKRQDLINQGIGGAQPNISQGILKNLDIPLPPLHEQSSIVEKIEELFSELDKGIENLRTAQQQLKVYRQAVLKWAFEAVLKPKILSVDECCGKIVDCLHSTAKFKEVGKYCVDTTCIDDNKILFDKIRYVDDATFNERISRLRPEHEDILFAREGTVGTAVLVPKGIDICLGQRMMMFRTNSLLVPKYFLYYLQSPHFKSQYRPLILGTTAPHLNIKDIKKFKVIIGSPNEQNQIVQEIESRLSVCDKMEETITDSLRQAEALRLSIFKRAFEGRLVKELYETMITT